MKNEIRKKYKALRSSFCESITASKAAAESFVKSYEYINCKNLFIFLSFGSEIETRDIIKRAFDDNKTVALPYMTGRSHEMVFIKISSLSELVKNKIGIYEPVYDNSNIVKSDRDTLIVIPGLAFDLKGSRLGYGGGYYDKYLSENEYMASVGLCFDFQITDYVPVDKNDIKIDTVITDRRVIK